MTTTTTTTAAAAAAAKTAEANLGAKTPGFLSPPPMSRPERAASPCPSVRSSERLIRYRQLVAERSLRLVEEAEEALFQTDSSGGRYKERQPTEDGSPSTTTSSSSLSSSDGEGVVQENGGASIPTRQNLNSMLLAEKDQGTSTTAPQPSKDKLHQMNGRPFRNASKPPPLAMANNISNNNNNNNNNNSKKRVVIKSPESSPNSDNGNKENRAGSTPYDNLRRRMKAAVKSTPSPMSRFVIPRGAKSLRADRDDDEKEPDGLPDSSGSKPPRRPQGEGASAFTFTDSLDALECQQQQHFRPASVAKPSPSAVSAVSDLTMPVIAELQDKQEKESSPVVMPSSTETIENAPTDNEDENSSSDMAMVGSAGVNGRGNVQQPPDDESAADSIVFADSIHSTAHSIRVRKDATSNKELTLSYSTTSSQSTSQVRTDKLPSNYVPMLSRIVSHEDTEGVVQSEEGVNQTSIPTGPSPVMPMSAFRRQVNGLATEDGSQRDASSRIASAALKFETATKADAHTAPKRVSPSDTDDHDDASTLTENDCVAPNSGSGRRNHMAEKLYQRNETLTQEVLFAGQTCVELGEWNRALQRERDDLRTELERLREENARLHGAVVDAVTKAARIDESRNTLLQHFSHQKDVHHSEVSRLAKQLAESKRAEAATHDKFEECRRDNVTLNTTLTKTTKQLESLTLDYEAANAILAKRTEQLSVATKRAMSVESLQREVDSLRQDKEQLQLQRQGNDVVTDVNVGDFGGEGEGAEDGTETLSSCDGKTVQGSEAKELKQHLFRVLRGSGASKDQLRSILRVCIEFMTQRLVTLKSTMTDKLAAQDEMLQRMTEQSQHLLTHLEITQSSADADSDGDLTVNHSLADVLDCVDDEDGDVQHSANDNVVLDATFRGGSGSESETMGDATSQIDAMELLEEARDSSQHGAQPTHRNSTCTTCACARRMEERMSEKLRFAAIELQTVQNEKDDLEGHFQSQLQELRKAYEETKDSLRHKVAALTDTEERLEKKTEEVTALQLQLQETEATLVRQTKEWHCQHENVKAALEQSSSERAKQEEVLREKETTIEELTATKADMENKLCARLEELRKHEQETKDLLAQSTAELANFKDMVKQKKCDVEALQTENENLRTTLEESHAELEMQLDKRKKLMEQADETVAHKEEVIRTKEEQLKYESQKNESLDKKCARYREYVDKLTQKCTEWSESFAKQGTEVATAQQARDEALCKITLLRSEINCHIESSRKDQDEWSEERARLQDKNKRLQEELTRVRKTIEVMSGRASQPPSPLCNTCQCGVGTPFLDNNKQDTDLNCKTFFDAEDDNGTPFASPEGELHV